MTQTPGDYLLFRYLKGNCTLEEEKQVEKWLMEDKSHADRFEAFVMQHANPVEINKDRIRWNLFGVMEDTFDKKRQRFSRSEQMFSEPGFLQKRSSSRWLAAAAMILVTITAGIFAHYVKIEEPADQPPKFIERTVPAGSTATLTLGDGSVVKLNAGSKLRFPENPGMVSGVREVFLEGEAFFEVTKNEGKPFIVHSGDLETTVLGTAFNVKAYPEEKVAQVTVAEGKVSVKQKMKLQKEYSGEPVLLEPDQWITYDRNNEELKKEQGDIRELLSWKDGILLFHDKTVEEVATMLERWYDTTIIVQEETVQNCLIHGEYKDKSLETVLRMIQYALDVNYSFTDEGVILSGGRCQ